MDELEFLNAVYDIVTARGFSPWAAVADHHFKPVHGDLKYALDEWLNYSHAIELFVAQYIPHRIGTLRRHIPALPERPHCESEHHSGGY
ncbi:hypothetical protein Rt10032_c02g1097 [Rhodotorula toruloides]|uniref:Uncharacterized protein n=1 Tax=Rhodotorula toruloides TaxID=5286 RepID=A0A511K9P9_RHOTO|nr:hypothetical protein Rt10032_c02g1097 [Rhodotorula toruloides]